MPKLSIIVPVYKVEKYLAKCIESILSQTFKDFELILVDDGSPDHCGFICDEYAKKDPRIKVLHQKNKGVSAARNAALNIAKGTYLGFVDADDWIDQDMFQVMLHTALTKEADVVICGINYRSDAGELIRSDLLEKATFNQKQLLINLYGMPNPIGGGCVNKIFRRSKVKNIRFRENLSMAEDWVYLFECFKQCDSGYQIPAAFYNVVERSDSTTRKNEVQAIYDIIFGGKLLLLLLLGRNYSIELEKYATDKYLDDCIRYSNILRTVGKETKQPYRWKFIKIRLQMLKVIPRAGFKRLLPAAKIRGYIYEALRG